MRVSTFTLGFALFSAGTLALDKPLDIKVDKKVECARKTQKGTRTSAHLLRASY